MKKERNRRLILGLSVLLLGFLTACRAPAVQKDATAEGIAPLRFSEESTEETAVSSTEDELLGRIENDAGRVSEEGSYSQKEEVALYLHLFGHLPDNYITKREAKELGWDSSLGNLWEVAPGKSIGGDHFGNYEGLLPEEDDRDYFECDIDYEGGRRNAKRMIYSDDGLIFYTEDHYASFEQLYGE